jgi:diadenosine tetraphosphate (Ap4A) HIT family hydrolase
MEGAKKPPGGLIFETPLFVAHALLAPCPIEGWVVLAPRRHARWWWELTDEESRELGPLARMILLAQRKTLGAEHGYAFAIGDVLQHMHLHLVPRYAGTPKHLRGRSAFEARPEEMLPEEQVAAAARKLRSGLEVDS